MRKQELKKRQSIEKLGEIERTTDDIEFLYELIACKDNKFKILIKIMDKTKGIDTIEYPDGDIQKCNGREQVAIDYEVEEEVEYVFVAKSLDGKEKRQVIKPKKLNLVEDSNPYYTFQAKANTNYLIQCYGAQGGSYSEYNHGGYGGYSYGIFTPNEDVMLYIYKGTMGIGGISNDAIEGGYNGGGSVPRLGRFS